MYTSRICFDSDCFITPSDHSIFGEEAGVSVGKDGNQYCWVIDPIDGTKSFITGEPTAAVSHARLQSHYCITSVFAFVICRETVVWDADFVIARRAAGMALILHILANEVGLN